jgi:undecaprenyl-diphosphatase
LSAFLRLGAYAQRGEPHAWDEALLRVLRSPEDPANPVGPTWLEELVRDVTALGGLGVIAFVTLAVAGFLVAVGRRRTALLLCASVAGGAALSFFLKTVYGRPRPDLVPHGARVLTESFPSGHAAVSAVAYLTLGALLARVQPRRLLRTYVLGLAVLITLCVGASRVYLGVHWPSDVAGGWAFGCAWALLVWFLEGLLQRRGQVEPAPKPAPGDG